MFLGYAENGKGYRVFDLENDKINVTRFMKLDEREVDGICGTQEVKSKTFIQVTKDSDEVEQHMVRQPDVDEPMEAVKDSFTDVDMDDADHIPSIFVP